MESLSVVPSSRLLIVPPRTPADILHRRQGHSWIVQLSARDRRRRGCVVMASGRRAGSETPQVSAGTLPKEGFATISSYSAETSSIGTPKTPLSPPPSPVGSPLFWIAVGVGFSALFSWVANYLKKYAMQQALKTLMGQMPPPDKSQFSNSHIFPGQSFPFPTASSSTTTVQSSPSLAASQPAVTVDISATDVKTSTGVTEDVGSKKEPKKYAFVDVAPEEASQSTAKDVIPPSSEVSSSNGFASKQDTSDNMNAQSPKPSAFSVDTLEKMLDDPVMQKMILPYLPQEMRNPNTIKWMLQDPQCRQQLHEQLDKIGLAGLSDKELQDSLKDFDPDNPEVRQKFAQIGLTPEEVLSKMMANPEIAMSFQNPKVQAAILDCSQNPMNISKYQDDKEIMDLFNQISELFGAPKSF